jgi:predicted esterase
MDTGPHTGAPFDIRVRERHTLRTARYAVAGQEPANATRIWIVLHGYGMLASRFLRAFDSTIPDDTSVIAPEALSRFYLEAPRADGGHLKKVGATWLTRESRDTEIVDAHRWLDTVYDDVVAESTARRGTPPTVGIFGFSQGVATAMRWIATGHPAPRHFVLWAGGVALDVNGEALQTALQTTETVLVYGDRDPLVTPAAQQSTHAALAALGIAFREETFAGAHHLDTPLLTTVLHALPHPTI